MNTPSETPENGRPSFLDQILSEWASVPTEASAVAPAQASDGVTPASAGPEPAGGTPTTPPPTPPKKREPMTPGQFFKILGALFLVALIFFGSFLAYIAFNPAEARFFIKFGIRLADVAALLSTLVNAIFGSITFVLCVVWVVLLFRAIITKKEYKRKKTIFVIAAAFVGMILFSNIGFWAFLFEKIRASDFVKPDGWVTAYDNDLYLSDEFRSSAEILTFSNMIGPIDIRYDLSSDVKHVSRSMTITDFEIDYDGDGTVDKTGSDPENDKSLLFNYARKGKFTPKGTYSGIDFVTNEEVTVPIKFEPINIAATVDIKETDSNVVYDATDLAPLGKLAWYTGDNLDVPASREAKFTVKNEKNDAYVCLVVENDPKDNEICDRIFFVKPKAEAVLSATLVIQKSPSDDLTYTLSLADKKSKSGGEIESVKWFVDATEVNSKEESFDYRFSTYGTYKVSAELADAAGNRATVSERLVIVKPLQLSRGSNADSLLKVRDESGNSLLDNAFSVDLDAYRIENVSPPARVSFDASDMRVKEDGYALKEVEWDIDGTKKKGLQTTHDFVDERRYEIRVKYIFEKTGTGEEFEVFERKIIFEGKKKDIAPQLSITTEDQGDLDSLYAPARLTFDGSASSVKEGKIAKFVYDFGEGKEPSEGDALKTYVYEIPGVYTVTFTIVKEDGSKASISRKIIVKATAKTLSINTSKSSASVGSAIDFEVAVSGQVEKYEWNFGDGTPTTNEANPTHIFSAAGTYKVKLTATYADGTIRMAEKEMMVGE